MYRYSELNVYKFYSQTSDEKILKDISISSVIIAFMDRFIKIECSVFCKLKIILVENLSSYIFGDTS